MREHNLSPKSFPLSSFSLFALTCVQSLFSCDVLWDYKLFNISTAKGTAKKLPPTLKSFLRHGRKINRNSESFLLFRLHLNLSDAEFPFCEELQEPREALTRENKSIKFVKLCRNFERWTAPHASDNLRALAEIWIELDGYGIRKRGALMSPLNGFCLARELMFTSITWNFVENKVYNLRFNSILGILLPAASLLHNDRLRCI